MPVLCVNTSTLGVVTLHLSGLDPRRSCVHPVTMRWVFGMNLFTSNVTPVRER